MVQDTLQKVCFYKSFLFTKLYKRHCMYRYTLHNITEVTSIYQYHNYVSCYIDTKGFKFHHCWSGYWLSLYTPNMVNPIHLCCILSFEPLLYLAGIMETLVAIKFPIPFTTKKISWLIPRKKTNSSYFYWRREKNYLIETSRQATHNKTYNLRYNECHTF